MTGLLLLAAMPALLWMPLVGVVLLASGLVVLGVSALSDFALRGESRFDPRGATLFLLAGVGTLGVVGTRMLWG